MKVVCIIQSTWQSVLHPNEDRTGPVFGEVCTAHQCDVHDDAYVLEEYPNNVMGQPQAFVKKSFAPISSVDETEFVREYNKELV